jgi:pimeloyl-ACP methyl ester carboxylesterase
MEQPTSQISLRTETGVSRIGVDLGFLNYEVFSEVGEPLVVLSGMSFSSAYYRDFCISLADRFKVFTLDHRRIGASTARAPWSYTVFDHAKDVLTVASEIGAQGFHVVGESYGGMLAMALAIRAPSRIKSLTLINSSYGGCRYPRITPWAIIAGIRWIVRPDKVANRLARILFSPHTLKHRPEIYEKWENNVNEHGIRWIISYKQVLGALRFKVAEDLPRIHAPTLIIRGDKDRLCPPHNSVLLNQQIANSQLVTIENGGHHLCLEHIPQLRENIIKFIEKDAI